MPINERQKMTTSTEARPNGVRAISQAVISGLMGSKSKECTVWETERANFASPQPMSATVHSEGLKKKKKIQKKTISNFNNSLK